MQGSDGKHMVLQGLDNSVKNFLTSVPLVADLRSPAMRDRHWTQLMTTTKVSTAGRGRHYPCCRFELWLGCFANHAPQTFMPANASIQHLCSLAIMRMESSG